MQVSFLSTLHAFLSPWYLIYWTFKKQIYHNARTKHQCGKISFESSFPVRVIQFESIQLILDGRLLKSKYFALGNTILKYFVQANLLSQATFCNTSCSQCVANHWADKYEINSFEIWVS